MKSKLSTRDLLKTIGDDEQDNKKLKAELRNLQFVNHALSKACTDLNDENLKLKIDNETLNCEVELLKKDEIREEAHRYREMS